MRSANSTSPPSESFSYAIVRALAGQREIFSGVAGFTAFAFDVDANGSVGRVPGAMVTGGFYDTLGLSPVAGRLLTAEDDEAGAALVTVLSDGYWQRQFAGNPDVIGQSIRINGLPVTVVGVNPRMFVGATVGSVADVTMAVAALPRVSPSAAPLLGPGNFWLRVLARPREGVSKAQATAYLDAAWPHMADRVLAPHWSVSQRKALAESIFELSPGGTGWTFLREMYRAPLFVLMAAVGLVLLIACANVASLLLARAASRQREIAVRLAMGAGRARIVRQLLIESILLSLIGAVVGVGLAWTSGRFLVAMFSTGPVKVTFDLTPNWQVLGFTSAIAIATGILFGLAPAVQTTVQGRSLAALGDGRVGGSRSRLLPALVSAQVALSLVLLAGAGLFVRTLHNLHKLDPGFNSQGVLLVDLEGRRPSASPPAQLLDDLRRLPNVLSASLSTDTPLNGWVWSEPAVPAGQPIPDRDNAHFIGAGPDFFATMQIRVLAGRTFTEGDSAEAPTVAMVNEAYAQRHFPNQNVLGQHLAAKVDGERRDLEIVGLVRNTNLAGLRSAPPPTVYMAYAQLHGDSRATLAVRATGSLGQVSSAIEQALQSRLAGAPIEVRPLSRQVEATIVQERIVATLASGFGLLALTLACIGFYGLLAYSVAQRTKEIGIRMALGAPGPRVVTLVLGNGTRLVLIGMAIGLPAAFAAALSVRSMLFGLVPADPMALGGAVALLAIAAQLAAYLPARRASRVDPMVACAMSEPPLAGMNGAPDPGLMTSEEHQTDR